MANPLQNTSTFPWVRFWAPTGTQVFDDKDGFPVYRSNRNGIYPASTIAMPISDWENFQCLVLLGEPGTGKTTELKCASGPSGIQVHYNLSNSSSEVGLIQAIEDIVKFQQWKQTDEKIYLYLDGFDEAQLSIRKISFALTGWLAKNSELFRIKQGLFHIRLACRSSAWPTHATSSLEDIFGNENVRLLELCPLAVDDIRTAALANDLDPDKFIESLKSNGLVKLALEPVTLKFLLNAFANGELAKSGTDKYKLYSSGCLNLCAEMNTGYIGAKNLSASQRMNIAARIAMYMLISNKQTILSSDTRLGVQETDLTADDVVNDQFIIDGKEEKISQQAFIEVLDCALFSRHEESQFKFKHKTYAEFLAAWHLQNLKMPLSMLQTLFTSPFNSRILTPQLIEVAGWILLPNEEFYKSLGHEKPLMLISTPREFTEVERKKLSTALLQKAKNHELIDEFDTRKFYSKLNNDNLVNLIRQTIRSKTANNVSRRIALNLAAECRIKDVVDDVLGLLSNTTIPTYTRAEAASVIASLGDYKQLATLKSLTLPNCEGDNDDEIKGVVLTELYPRLISTPEMFEAIAQVKKNNLYGSYRGFLDTVGHNIPVDDLPLALETLLDRDDILQTGTHGDFENFLKSLLKKGWQNLQIPSVLRSVSRLVLTFSARGDYAEIPDLERLRRPVAEYIIQNEFEPPEPFSLISGGRPLLLSSDWGWLVGLFGNESEEIKKLFIGRILFCLFNINDPRQVLEMLEIGYGYKPLWKTMAYWVDEVELGSEEETKMRSRFQRVNDPVRSKPKIIAEPIDALTVVNEKVAECLTKLEQGDNDSWWKLVLQLRFNSEGRGDDAMDYIYDLRKLPGWELLTDANKFNLIRGSKLFLKNYSPSPVWDRKRADLAGYKALLLLLNIDRTAFNELGKEFWRVWTPTVLHCTFFTTNEIPTDQALILATNYKLSPDAFVEELRKNLRERLKRNSDLYDLYKINPVMDDTICELLLDLVSDDACTFSNQRSIVEALYRVNSPLVKKLAQKSFKAVFEKNDTSELSLFFASRWLLELDEKQWPAVWSLLRSNNVAGQAVFKAASDRLGYNRSDKLMRITPVQKAQLLTWLIQNFPSTDTGDDNDDLFSKSGSLTEFRSQVIRSLVESGTLESVGALRTTINQNPNLTDLKWWLVTAEETLHRKAWRPIPVVQLRELLNNSQKKIVRNDIDLQNVVVESLARFQKKLKGNNPLSPFLWDKSFGKGATKYTPKDENTLSDLIKVHLEYDLVERNVIINREVEIKKSFVKGGGERTDLLVQCKIEGDEVINLVIEAKGCWNTEVHQSMEDQLRKRYLAKHKSRVGIYVVGWFYGTHNPIPKSIVSKASFKSLLDKQAKSLSDDTVKIDSVLLDCSF